MNAPMIIAEIHLAYGTPLTAPFPLEDLPFRLIF